VQAQMGKGWYEAAKEFAKMDGFNVMTVTRVQTTVDGEVMMVPESQQQAGVAPQVNAGDVAKDAATSTALGRMGRAGAIGGALGGLRRKKPAAVGQHGSGHHHGNDHGGDFGVPRSRGRFEVRCPRRIQASGIGDEEARKVTTVEGCPNHRDGPGSASTAQASLMN
jgi:hypothetical protein